MIASPPRSDIAFESSDDLHALARARRDRVRFVLVPRHEYFAIDGTEPPGGEIYMASIGTLYPVAYSLHFALRRRGLQPRIGMLEGLYWLAPEDAPPDDEREVWRWRLLLAVPRGATESEVEGAIREAGERRPLPQLSRLRTITWQEGPAAQIVHVGPYGDETPTIQRLHQAIVEAGYEPHGQHHEIYLNNPQQVGEARAKTLIRRQMRRMPSGGF